MKECLVTQVNLLSTLSAVLSDSKRNCMVLYLVVRKIMAMIGDHECGSLKDRGESSGCAEICASFAWGREMVNIWSSY